MKRSTLLTILILAAFGLLLFYNTVSAQKVECSVCVEFKEIGRASCRERV